jgi:hypothetical protein
MARAAKKSATGKLRSPVILTEEERYFRVALRQFVLSNVSELNQSFGYALGILNNITDEIGNRRSSLTPNEQEKITNLINMFQKLIGYQFFSNVAPIIVASNKTVEDMEPTQLAGLIKKFFDGYRKAQASFKQFIRISELNPNKTDLEKLLSADARALNALRDLKSFPDAKGLEGIDEGYFLTRTGFFANYLHPGKSE